MIINNIGYVLQWHKNENGVAQGKLECLDFGDDNFTIGCWEANILLVEMGR